MAQDVPTVTDETPWWQKLLKLNPAVVRGVLVAILAVVAQVLGHTVVSDDTVDLIINAFTAIAPIIAGLFIKGAVTPNAKVEAYKPDPVKAPDVVVAGEASAVQTGAQVDSATPVSQTDGEAAVAALSSGDNVPVPPADNETGGGTNSAGESDTPDALSETDIAIRDAEDAEVPDTDDVESLPVASDDGVPGSPDDTQGPDVSEATK